MFGRRFRSGLAALLGAALIASIFQILPAQAVTALSYKYEFGAQTTTPVSGYTLDYGQPFNGTFGWENASSGVPTSYVGNGRDRGANSNKLMDRLMQAQLVSSSAGNHTTGQWQLAVANGTYSVTIGVGDPSYTDSTDVWNVNGTQIVNFKPTVAKPQTTASASVTVTNGLLTLAPASAGVNDKVDYIDIEPSSVTPPPGDTTPPVVSVAINGSTNPSGAYVNSATVAVTATDVGSGVKSISYSLDGSSSTAYKTPVQVSTNGSHTVSVTATDNSNNTSSAVTKTFIVTSGGSTKSTSLVVSTPDDSLGLGSRLVFSTVYNESRSGQNITLTNKGTSTLRISALNITKNFVLCSGQVTSFSIAAGKSTSVCVDYRDTVDAAAQGTQVDQGTLTIVSNDSAVPNYVVTLGGLDSQNYEGSSEPSLQQVADALGYTDNVAVTNAPQGNSISASSNPVGDEILAPYYKALDGTKPVRLIPVAHYSGLDSDDSAPFGWYAKGSSSTVHNLYSTQGGSDGTNDGYGQNQLLLPAEKKCSSGCSGSDAFSPSGSFGLTDNYDGSTSYTDDALNPSGWHNLRSYPAKDANGKVIPGEYLIGDDVGAPTDNSAKNWDYQDFVFLLTNATPDGSKQPTAGIDNQNVNSFGNAGGISGTGFTSYQGSKSSTGHVAVNGGKLQILTSADPNNSHTNALQVGVNAGDVFVIQSRLIGPFTNISGGEDMQGIFFGPSASQYVKAEIDYENGARHLTVWEQTSNSDSGGQVIASTALPNKDGTNNANSVDLQIAIDPSPQDAQYYDGPPRVTVSYALDGGSFTTLGSTFNIPESWITASTPAGVMTSSYGGSPFTATYSNFTINRNF